MRESLGKEEWLFYQLYSLQTFHQVNIQRPKDDFLPVGTQNHSICTIINSIVNMININKMLLLLIKLLYFKWWLKPAFTSST